MEREVSRIPFFGNISVGRLKKKIHKMSDREIDQLLMEYGIPSPGEMEKPGSYIRNTTRKGIVENRRKNDIVVIPVGSTENHGPHSVSGPDSLQITRIAEAVRRKTKKMGTPINIAYP